MYKIKKHKEFIKYVLISIITTCINVISYIFFMYILDEMYIISNVFAWIISVFTSFILSKRIVFNLNFENKKKIFYELILFYTLRLTSLLIDTAILHICIKYLKTGNIFGKIISNIGTTFNNYFISKYLIFKKEIKSEKIDKEEI